METTSRIAARRQKLVEPRRRQFGDNGQLCDAQADLFTPVVICVFGNRSRGGRGSACTEDSFHGAVRHSATA